MQKLLNAEVPTGQIVGTSQDEENMNNLSVSAWYHENRRTLVIRAPKDTGLLIAITNRCPVDTVTYDTSVGALVITHAVEARPALIAQIVLNKKYPEVEIDESGLNDLDEIRSLAETSAILQGRHRVVGVSA